MKILTLAEVKLPKTVTIKEEEFFYLYKTMKNKKLCCRIFPIVLILISTIFAIALWYFDENINQFIFLKDWGEFINFLGTVLFISIIPIGLFYYLVEKEKYETHARQLALLGFLPTFLFFIFLFI